MMTCALNQEFENNSNTTMEYLLRSPVLGWTGFSGKIQLTSWVWSNIISTNSYIVGTESTQKIHKFTDTVCNISIMAFTQLVIVTIWTSFPRRAILVHAHWHQDWLRRQHVTLCLFSVFFNRTESKVQSLKTSKQFSLKLFQKKRLSLKTKSFKHPKARYVTGFMASNRGFVRKYSSSGEVLWTESNMLDQVR